MYRSLVKAIKADQEVIFSLLDGSKISGFPSWGVDRSRVRIKLADTTVWVPLDEVEHVTIVHNLNAKKTTDHIG